MLSAICFSLDQSKILSSGSGLKSKTCYFIDLNFQSIVNTDENIDNLLMVYFCFLHNLFFQLKDSIPSLEQKTILLIDPYFICYLQMLRIYKFEFLFHGKN